MLLLRRVIAHAAVLLGAAHLASCTPASNKLPDVPGLQRSVVFSDYSPLSRSSELMRRLMSPLEALRVRAESARLGVPLHAQRVDLAKETFALYVPPQVPSHGYALLVFVPPWDEAVVPRIWRTVLARHDMILVTAAKSGNDADLLNRREPLALLAADNVLHRYPVDPQRVYIGGFSGGARVALRLALGYPDVFHAALLNASSDLIGTAQVPLPPAPLFLQFQQSTRIVYVSGAHDTFNIAAAVLSRQSLQQWCVFDLATEDVPWAAHELLDAAAFSRALDSLFKHAPADAAKLAACRARIDDKLAADLQHAKGIAGGRQTHRGARASARYRCSFWGLAAPSSIELADK